MLAAVVAREVTAADLNVFALAVLNADPVTRTALAVLHADNDPHRLMKAIELAGLVIGTTVPRAASG